MKTKSNIQTPTYKITNWAEYNRSLVQRGNLHLWIEEDIEKTWISKISGKRGHPFVYSDKTIELFLTLRTLLHLPLRQTQGFMTWLLKTMHFSELSVPNYSQVCRRAIKLKVSLKPKINKNEELNIILDSTGLKVYGEGEWKVRKHGFSKRRKWRKNHLCIDSSTFYIVASELTDLKGGDPEVGINLIRDLATNENYNINDVRGDGIYDTHRFYFEATRNNIKPIVPPRKNARLLEEIYANPPPNAGERDKTIKSVREIGLKEWKKLSGYHSRSRVETAMFRYKQIIGAKLNSRSLEAQRTEHRIACKILNVMTSLGMPDTVPT